MAIAYVSGAQSTTSSGGTFAPGSHYWDITGTFGSTTANELTVYFFDYQSTATLGTVTLGGGSLTHITTGVIRAGNDSKVSIFVSFGLSGSNLRLAYTAEESLGQENFFSATSGIYSGVYDAGTGIEASVVSRQVTGDPCTVTLTTTTNADWLVGWSEEISGYVGAGADTTMRIDSISRKLFDSNADRAPGSNSLNIDKGGAGEFSEMAAVALISKDAFNAPPAQTMVFF